MTLVHRVLYPTAIESLAEYRKVRGGRGIEAARALSADEIIAELEASGLRGRGGAGFPTGRKWRTVRDYCSTFERTSVVVNAAEGEPGTYKDRTILRNDPYQVIEGALIAAHAVGADQIIFATKRSFSAEVGRLQSAIDEVKGAGWLDGIEVEVFEGPNEYLYGEETALLETIDGRYPLPRIAPPYRRGVREVVETAADIGTGSGSSAHVEMAGPGDDNDAPPALVDNVETMANVARILARGAEWFRTEGTEESPGTIVCTVTGATQHHGVGEVIMGTPLREVIEAIGGGARPGRRIRAVLPGVSSAFIDASALDTPVSYEALAAIGSGLGSAGFVVYDGADDLVAVAAGASRFLAIESCGQCTPCKLDGLRISELLDALTGNTAAANDVEELRSRVATVADGARCSLATQQQVIALSLLERYVGDVEAHVEKRTPAVNPAVVAELVAIDDGVAHIDERHADKQPDWTYDATDSGKTPAARLGEHRDPAALDE
ncbi:MAG: NADH-quinone oxidoreductase subunit [Actinomycetota bacterium]|jgi:NADH-quinone oxidoreductase subunit F|nr:NADH-quinone oxidoreductase subunit [Actinomycetota bacterium]